METKRNYKQLKLAPGVSDKRTVLFKNVRNNKKWRGNEFIGRMKARFSKLIANCIRSDNFARLK